ncbi:MAG TPA: ATPase domain-containing protein [Actinomycetota bacterium]|nr:ATPase domain-containing protein [Actinomycetota bacterium]
MSRVPTGIAALDRVLGGGFPPGSLVVIAGAPGTGKTILAQQICFANPRPSIYYTTLSEPHSKLVSHLQSFSFFSLEAIGERIRFHHLPSLADPPNPVSAEVAAEVARQAFESSPGVMVIDSSKALHEAEGPGFRRSIYDLASRVAHTDTLLILVGEYEEADMQTAPEFAVADAIILLTNEPSGLTDRRWLRVAKLRGSDHLAGRHAFRIGPDGLALFPRPEASLIPPPPGNGGRVSTGIEGLDAMTHGGIPVGTTTIVAGPSGAGKTVIALQFLIEGLKGGEPCVYVSFQESERQLREKARNFGWDLSGATAKGQLAILHVQPVEMGLDVVASQIHQAAAGIGARRVVIDSIGELSHAATGPRFPDYLWSLVGALRGEGATVVLASETEAFFGPAFELARGLSFVADNVVLLRYTELESEIHRALVVVKMRESDHVKSLVEFEITSGGAVVKGKFSGLSGVLSGAPVPAEQKFREFFGR